MDKRGEGCYIAIVAARSGATWGLRCQQGSGGVSRIQKKRSELAHKVRSRNKPHEVAGRWGRANQGEKPGDQVDSRFREQKPGGRAKQSEIRLNPTAQIHPVLGQGFIWGSWKFIWSQSASHSCQWMGKGLGQLWLACVTSCKVTGWDKQPRWSNWGPRFEDVAWKRGRRVKAAMLSCWLPQLQESKGSGREFNDIQNSQQQLHWHACELCTHWPCSAKPRGMGGGVQPSWICPSYHCFN